MNNIASILRSLSLKADLTLSQAEDAYKIATALSPEDRLIPLLTITQRMPKLITAQVTGSEATKAHRLLTVFAVNIYCLYAPIIYSVISAVIIGANHTASKLPI